MLGSGILSNQAYFERVGLRRERRGHLVIQRILLGEFMQNLPCAYEVAVQVMAVVHDEWLVEQQREEYKAEICGRPRRSRLQLSPRQQFSGSSALRVTPRSSPIAQ